MLQNRVQRAARAQQSPAEPSRAGLSAQQSCLGEVGGRPDLAFDLLTQNSSSSGPRQLSSTSSSLAAQGASSARRFPLSVPLSSFRGGTRRSTKVKDVPRATRDGAAQGTEEPFAAVTALPFSKAAGPAPRPHREITCCLGYVGAPPHLPARLAPPASSVIRPGWQEAPAPTCQEKQHFPQISDTLPGAARRLSSRTLLFSLSSRARPCLLGRRDISRGTLRRAAAPRRQGLCFRLSPPYYLLGYCKSTLIDGDQRRAC